MRGSIRCVGLALSLSLPVAAQAAEDGPLRNAPPVVVRTEPTAGRADVSAATTEIRVTFSKKMRDGSWSWSQISRESFPRMTGKPRYTADLRTCVLPVALEPGKTYVIWLNHAPAQNFEDQDGHKALEYLLVFRTRE